MVQALPQQTAPIVQVALIDLLVDLKDKEAAQALERVAGVTPRGYRSPSWELSEQSLPLLAEYRFAYDASQLARDRPYRIAVDGCIHLGPSR